MKEPIIFGLAVFLAICLLLFIAYPLISIFLKSIYQKGIFTLQGYVKFFSQRIYYRSLINSLILASITGVLTTFVAFNLAYVASRGPRFLRRFFTYISMSPIITPPFVFSMVLLILGGRQGIITSFLGIDFSLIGWPGLIIAQVLHFITVCFIMLHNNLKSIDPALEASAYNLGSGDLRVMTSVTIPLMMPGLFKSFLMAFILSMADFGNPAIIGKGVSFLAVDAFLLITGEFNFEMGSVFCVVLIIPSLAIFLIQQYVLGKKTVTTVTGKPTGLGVIKIRPYVQIPILAISLIVSLSLCSIYATLVTGAFVKLIGINNTFTLSHFFIRTELFLLKNTLLLSFYAASAGTITGMLLAYLFLRKNIPGRLILEFISLLGFAIPGTVVGIGYLMAFNKPPFVLTGTAAIIILSMTFRVIAVSVQAGEVGIRQIDIEVDYASTNLGAGALTTLKSIVFPLLFVAFLESFVYSLIFSINTISAVIFLVTPKLALASLRVFELANHGHFGSGCALSIVMILSIIGCLAIMRLIIKLLRPSTRVEI
jgi:iron(III) transport system permease protein